MCICACGCQIFPCALCLQFPRMYDRLAHLLMTSLWSKQQCHEGDALSTRSTPADFAKYSLLSISALFAATFHRLQTLFSSKKQSLAALRRQARMSTSKTHATMTFLLACAMVSQGASALCGALMQRCLCWTVASCWVTVFGRASGYIEACSPLHRCVSATSHLPCKGIASAHV